MAAAADGLSANAFESVLRAIGTGVPGLRLRPQVVVAVDPVLRPDLVDTAQRLVVEADSFTWHGGRQALVADCRRYNRLVLAGYRVLRFTWEDVMLRPDLVGSELAAAVAPLAQRTSRRRRTA